MTAASTATYPGVLVAKDVAIPVRDGIELAADVFRPDDDRAVPVIMTLGPYAKDVHFRDHPGGAAVYESMPEQGPLMHWETVNPEWWVPQGYGVVRVDARGTGHSPGRRTMLSRGEAQDFYRTIKAQVRAAGRAPDAALVMPGVLPVIGPTRRHAEEMFAELNRGIDGAQAFTVLSERLGADMDGAAVLLIRDAIHHRFWSRL